MGTYLAMQVRNQRDWIGLCWPGQRADGIEKGNLMSTVVRQAESPATLIDVKEVAEKLGCSTRHVYRLADSGRMPTPVKLGVLVRWVLPELDAWIADGCPRCNGRGRR